MFIQPINNVYYPKSKTVTKKALNPNTDKINFKGYREEIASAADKKIRNLSDYKNLFDNLLLAAKNDGHAERETLYAIVTSTKSLWQKLNHIKENFSDVTLPIISLGSSNLVSAHYGNIRFHGDYVPHLKVTEDVDFRLDSDMDFVMERPFDLEKFYTNGNKKLHTVYAGDYGSSKTTYYDKDGSEPFWKNFLFG